LDSIERKRRWRRDEIWSLWVDQEKMNKVEEKEGEWE